MSGRLGTAIISGGAGMGGAYAFNNRDHLEYLMPSFGARSGMQQDRSGSDLHMSRLSEQIDALARNQRNANTYLVQSGQPSTFLGIPVWQIVGVAGTAGVIYWKVKGYAFNDLVYVSKKHFNDITEVINEQIKTLEVTVGEVKIALMERIGLVEKRVDEAQLSIEAKIDEEISKVHSNMQQFTSDLSALQRDMTESRTATSAIASDVTSVKSDVAHLKDHLRQVSSSVSLHTEKLEEFNETLAQNMEKQNKGIGLLCKYVASTDGGAKGNADILNELREYASMDAQPSSSQQVERRGLMMRAGLQPSRVPRVTYAS